MILDTGAGPNCVSVRYLPQWWEKHKNKSELVVLKATNGMSMKTLGRLPLWIRLGDYKTRDHFLICEELPVPIILGAKFIDTNIAVIRHDTQTIVLKNGSTAPVVREVEKEQFPARTREGSCPIKCKTLQITSFESTTRQLLTLES